VRTLYIYLLPASGWWSHSLQSRTLCSCGRSELSRRRNSVLRPGAKWQRPQNVHASRCAADACSDVWRRLLDRFNRVQKNSWATSRRSLSKARANRENHLVMRTASLTRQGSKTPTARKLYNCHWDGAECKMVQTKRRRMLRCCEPSIKSVLPASTPPVKIGP